MSEPEKHGSVAYAAVDDQYFKKRELRRYAGALHIWGLGVGAVISGDYFGWQFGLISGGFGGMLIASLVIAVMYLALSFSIAEMSAALPHTGGAYSFARSSIGPWGGYITGLAENMEYILTPAVIVVAVGGYLGSIFGTPPSFAPLWWLIVYIAFVGINIWGVEASFRFSVVIAFLALGVLAVFCVAAIPHVDIQKYAMNIPPNPAKNGTPFLPEGMFGIFAALPFAIWFFLGIEELPLAAEEARNPVRDIPRGMVFGILTLIVSSILVLVLNSSIAPGAKAISTSTEPLLDGLKTIFGSGTGSKLLGLAAVAGLVASFHTIIFAYGRQIYSLSRAGYFPRFLSLTHGSRQTPHAALITGSAIGYAVALGVYFYDMWSGSGAGSSVGAIILCMAVFGAVISYIMQMVSYILLRVRLPHIKRPYKSPLGIFGAVLTLILSAVTLVILFIPSDVYAAAGIDPQKGVIGAAIWYALGMLYFALYGRKQLVKSPEEDFAIRELAKAKENRTGMKTVVAEVP